MAYYTIVIPLTQLFQVLQDPCIGHDTLIQCTRKGSFWRQRVVDGYHWSLQVTRPNAKIRLGDWEEGREGGGRERGGGRKKGKSDMIQTSWCSAFSPLTRITRKGCKILVKGLQDPCQRPTNKDIMILQIEGRLTQWQRRYSATWLFVRSDCHR